MSQSEDPKVGETVKYNIGGKEVHMLPVPLGKMKKAMTVLRSDGDVFDCVAGAVTELLNNGENDFASLQWVQDNVTLPQATKIIDDARTINGTGKNGFFATGESAQTRELQEKAPTP